MTLPERIDFYSWKLAPSELAIQRDAKTRDDYRAEMWVLVWRIECQQPACAGRERYLSRSLRNYVMTQLRFRVRREGWEQLFAFEPDWELWGPSRDDTERHEASLTLAKIADALSVRECDVLLSAAGTSGKSAESRDLFDKDMAQSTFYWTCKRAREHAAAVV